MGEPLVHHVPMCGSRTARPTQRTRSGGCAMKDQPADEDLGEDRLVYLATGLASSFPEQRQEACVAYLGSCFASRVREHCAFRLGITGEWDIWDTQVDVMLALRRVPESRRETLLRGARGMSFVLRRARWS